MRDCDVVVLAFCSLPGEVSFECRVPNANVLRGVKDGVSKIAGASLLHVGVSAGSVELAGLVGRRRKAGIAR